VTDVSDQHIITCVRQGARLVHRGARGAGYTLRIEGGTVLVSVEPSAFSARDGDAAPPPQPLVRTLDLLEHTPTLAERWRGWRERRRMVRQYRREWEACKARHGIRLLPPVNADPDVLPPSAAIAPPPDQRCVTHPVAHGVWWCFTHESYDCRPVDPTDPVLPRSRCGALVTTATGTLTCEQYRPCPEHGGWFPTATRSGARP
jgi:hypothetical protein